MLSSRPARFRALVLALFAALVVASLWPTSPPVEAAGERPPTGVAAAPAKPNIVLFLLDDMRADELKFLPKTQRWMRRNGVKYTNAISPHPLCCPARSELFTGQYGQNNGVHHNTGPAGGFSSLSAPDNNLGTWLQESGYRTSFTGKFLNGYKKSVQPNGDLWYDKVDGWDNWDPIVRGTYRYTRSTFWDKSKYRDKYITKVMRKRVKATIDDYQDDPLFLYVNHTAPHDGSKKEAEDSEDGVGWLVPKYEKKYAASYRRYVPKVFKTPSFLEKDVSDLPMDMRSPQKLTRKNMLDVARARARALRSVDDSIMGTISDLRKAGKLDNSYVVVTSDNGYHLGEHRYKGKNMVFDASTRIPLLVSSPSRKSGTIEKQVTLLDLTASIVAWGGAVPGRTPDGLPLHRVARSSRDTVLIQTGSDQATAATDFWSYRGVRTDRYVFGYNEGTGQGVLFDLEKDPLQLVNRFEDNRYTTVRSDLMGRTEELSNCQGRDCNLSGRPEPQPIGRAAEGWRRPPS